MDRERVPRNENFDEETQTRILREMLLRLSDKLDKSIGSFSYDLLSPVSIKMTQLNTQGKLVEDKLFIKNLTGQDLDTRVFELSGLTRKPATKATGTVVITGTSDTVVEVGTLVSTDTVRFSVITEGVIGEDGSTEVIVECEEEGSIGSVAAHMIKLFPITVQGLVSVTNPEAFDNGFDEETDKSLYDRYIEFIRTPSTSGNVYHYMQWAKEVDGVGDVKVQDAKEVGAGNVRVVIIDRNQGVASEELMKATYDHIETKRPVGANVIVATGVPRDIVITADVDIAEKHTIQSVTKDFVNGLEEYRKEIVFKQTYISYARIYQILMTTEGVLDSENLKLNGDIKNIALGDEDIPIFPDPNLTPIQREG